MGDLNDRQARFEVWATAAKEVRPWLCIDSARLGYQAAEAVTIERLPCYEERLGYNACSVASRSVFCPRCAALRALGECKTCKDKRQVVVPCSTPPNKNCLNSGFSYEPCPACTLEVK